MPFFLQGFWRIKLARLILFRRILIKNAAVYTIRYCVYTQVTKLIVFNNSRLILRYRVLSTVKRPSRNSRQIAILVHEANAILRKGFQRRFVRSYLAAEITMPPLLAHRRSWKITDKQAREMRTKPQHCEPNQSDLYFHRANLYIFKPFEFLLSLSLPEKKTLLDKPVNIYTFMYVKSVLHYIFNINIILKLPYVLKKRNEQSYKVHIVVINK